MASFKIAILPPRQAALLVLVMAALCGQRERMRENAAHTTMRVTRFPDSTCEATIWGTAAGPLTGEGVVGWGDRGQGRSWKAAQDNACC